MKCGWNICCSRASGTNQSKVPKCKVTTSQRQTAAQLLSIGGHPKALMVSGSLCCLSRFCSPFSLLSPPFESVHSCHIVFTGCYDRERSDTNLNFTQTTAMCADRGLFFLFNFSCVKRIGLTRLNPGCVDFYLVTKEILYTACNHLFW